jgi:hypothetical protein
MWLSKWFRRREASDPGEEPARFPTVVDTTRPGATGSGAKTGTNSGPITDLKRHTRDSLQPKGGFDPYNSGSFQKKSAWEKVVRK